MLMPFKGIFVQNMFLRPNILYLYSSLYRIILFSKMTSENLLSVETFIYLCPISSIIRPEWYLYDTFIILNH
jgi:hypothetical protein